MNSIYKLLAEIEEYAQVKSAVQQGLLPVAAQGLAPIHKAQFIHGLSHDLQRGAFIVVQDEQTAARLCDEINLLEGEIIAYHYPEREITFSAIDGISKEYEHLRIGILARMLENSNGICVMSVDAALQATIPPNSLIEHTITINSGEEYGEEELLRQLVWAGYARCEQVDGVSQFACRGGIVDFYPPNYTSPIRVEFWGDEVDTIATFSIETQRRGDTLQSATVTPVREVLYEAEHLAKLLQKEYDELSEKQKDKGGASLLRDIELLTGGAEINTSDRYLPLIYPNCETALNYLGDRMLFILEHHYIKERADHLRWQQEEDLKQLLTDGVITRSTTGAFCDYYMIEKYILNGSAILLDGFVRQYKTLAVKEVVQCNLHSLSVWSGELMTLVEQLNEFLADGYGCVVLNGTERGSVALAEDLKHYKIDAQFSKKRDVFEKGKVFVCPGGLSYGCEIPSIGLAIISYGRGAHLNTGTKRKKIVPKGQRAIRDIGDLSVGDYVVHASHGIGIFDGIVKRETAGITKDFIKVNYASEDRLFVPVTQLEMVTKYIGGKDDSNVKINRLNSQSWNKTRQRVKVACADMAKELISLYADRLHAQGHAFAADGDWQVEFEHKFPYEETDDQLRCIDEIKMDMERGTPMDRLLCGDVGFGKTEVALRAIFKCVMDGKQCAVMVPTTILAWQHYQTFVRRLEGFPIKVELLSRFRTPKEQRQVVAGLKDGSVDLVIGTHKLVQKDVAFKDLGLCVIDEEQRFGVAHKERFKELRTSVDVLTLSATPIPRTLNMAMSGIRDMSLIEEAPQDRHPVQSYALEYDRSIIMEAIRKELRRGGQVFYLHNRVDTISDCTTIINEAIPEARVAIAHGKMGEESLSNVWRQLVEREVDILVCTTIIETGVDVPNCNTLIIEDADKMGLSQLHQLRGRVGRSDRRAYAYFTFKADKVLTELGEKRLNAIKEFTSFGSGFRIAMRDLEIRGAGDILGGQQHGHMESVGYDLYLKLLGEAISLQRGDKVTKSCECQVDLPINAHIPEEYIASMAQRVDIYKKIAVVTNTDDYMDVVDELIDRFGEPPAPVRGLLDVALIRNNAASHGVTRVSKRDKNALFYLEKLEMDAIVPIVKRMKGKVLVSAGENPYISVAMQKGESMVDILNEVFGQ